MSHLQVVRSLSPSVSLDSASCSSFQFALKGLHQGTTSKFHVYDARKCSRVGPQATGPRDSDFPLPPTKPKRTRNEQQKANRHQAQQQQQQTSNCPPAQREPWSSPVGSPTAANCAPLPKPRPQEPPEFEDWFEDEGEQQKNDAANGVEEAPEKFLGFVKDEENLAKECQVLGVAAPGSLHGVSAGSATSEGNSGGSEFYGMSYTAETSCTNSAMIRFRDDLDEVVQRRIIQEYWKEQHEAWVALHPAASSKSVRTWPKRQQALSLAVLVAEAHLFQRGLARAQQQVKPPTPPKCPPPTRTVNAPRNPMFDSIKPVAPPPPRPQQPQQPKLDIKNARVAAMLLYDVFLLVDNHEEGADRYEAIRTQIIGLTLWQ